MTGIIGRLGYDDLNKARMPKCTRKKTLRKLVTVMLPPGGILWGITGYYATIVHTDKCVS